MRNLKIAAFMLFGIATLNSCLLPYPDDSELYEDVATITSHDADEDFSRFTTYSIPDSVFFVDDDSTFSPVQAQYSAQLVAAVVDNMNSRGYARVEKFQDPDMLINMTAWETLNVVIYPGYWYDYYDCYYWGYNCGWWYYPSYPTVSTYKSGSLVIDIVNRRDAIDDETGFLAIPWTSVVYALSSSSPDFNLEKALKGIDAAFEQSPYLTK